MSNAGAIAAAKARTRLAFERELPPAIVAEATVERQAAYAERQRLAQREWRIAHVEERQNEAAMRRADATAAEWFPDEAGTSKAAKRASDSLLAALQRHYPAGDPRVRA